jgi:hypothetical protein
VIECPVCRATYVANTIFCAECGLYLLESEDLGTDPLETAEVRWTGEADDPSRGSGDLADTGPLTVRLRIGKDGRGRELEVPLAKPIRLGRLDARQDIYPDVDLTEDLALKKGVSRLHACIFRRGNTVLVEDLGSTNGTLHNNTRLAPYLPALLKNGDQLQLGKMLIEVHFKTRDLQESLARQQVTNDVIGNLVPL